MGHTAFTTLADRAVHVLGQLQHFNQICKLFHSKRIISEKNYFDIPVWRRYTLTIEEAAGYYHIGEGKLRMLIDQNPHEDFYVMNGNRALIKREKFERYLDQATAV